MTALLRSIAGLIGWAVAFSMLYGLQGTACAFGWDGVRVAGVSVARLTLVITYLGWLAALGWLSWYLRPRVSRPDFLAWLAFASAVIGLASTVYTGMPVIVTSVCN